VYGTLHSVTGTLIPLNITEFMTMKSYIMATLSGYYMDYNYYVLGQVLKLVARTEVIRLCIFKFRLAHESWYAWFLSWSLLLLADTFLYCCQFLFVVQSLFGTMLNVILWRICSYVCIAWKHNTEILPEGQLTPASILQRREMTTLVVNPTRPSYMIEWGCGHHFVKHLPLLPAIL